MSHDIGHMYTLVAPKHKPYFIPSRLLLQKKKKKSVLAFYPNQYAVTTKEFPS